ncbi:hypothetical protein GRX03_12180 [Halovenus sp. WSH3]|uniref:Zinc ribbon domain-containing protein n=1 Tax=Halovenus carboxidivorans TaxID=2692199 RepID=A0A6B0T295_9EURY|nr:zinc ribbon domain-containing protein [Halovenus carboxidivorans]MXR52358.1 hypothetical protein [Halovenus carboxidivorans]
MADPVRCDGSGLFCPNCGNSATPEHDYCIHCGHDLAPLQEVADADYETTTERADAEQDRGRRSTGDDLTAFRRRIGYLVSRGWEIEYDGHDEVVLVDRGLGSIAIHSLLFIFTTGVGNLLYAWYHYSVAPTRVTLRADGEGYEILSPADPTAETPQGQSSPQTSPLQLGGGVAMLVIGIIMVLTTGLTLVSTLLGLASGIVGLYVLPPVRRRLRNRHTLMTFGPTETVDERYVEQTDRPCAICGSRVLDGLVREYEQEYVLAGLPLYTMERGENYYCRDCRSLDVSRELSGGVDTGYDTDENAEDSVTRELERLREDDAEAATGERERESGET